MWVTCPSYNLYLVLRQCFVYVVDLWQKQPLQCKKRKTCPQIHSWPISVEKSWDPGSLSVESRKAGEQVSSCKCDFTSGLATGTWPCLEDCDLQGRGWGWHFQFPPRCQAGGAFSQRKWRHWGRLCDQKQADFRMVVSILTIVSGALLIPQALAKPFVRLVSSHGPAAQRGRCYNYIPLSRALCFFLHDMGDTGLLSTRPTPGSPWIPGTPLRYPVSVRLTVWTINFTSFPSVRLRAGGMD